MFYVLLVLSCLNLVVRLGCTVLVLIRQGKAPFLVQHPQGSCTIAGPALPLGCPRGVRVHEWTHMLTLAPYWLLAMNFTWILFWPQGWLGAILISIGVNLLVMITLETVADIGAMVAVGPLRFMEELTEAYRELRVTRWSMLSVSLTYPVWRLWPMWVASKDTKPCCDGRNLCNRCNQALTDECRRQEAIEDQMVEDYRRQRLMRDFLDSLLDSAPFSDSLE